MPLTTNLSVSPYFDDYDNADNYYKILFKPATAVQVREMNQLQTILQNQIEEFGDHVLKSGTILDGCQFTFDSSIPFVKILDTTVGGAAVDVASYIGLYAEGEVSGAVGEVTFSIPGFESSDNAELSTLYLKYVDGGLNNDKASLEEGETIKIFSGQSSLYDIDVVPGGASQGFSNADVLVILSAIRVQNVTSSDTEFGSNTFTVGDILKDDASSPTIEVEVYDTPFIDTETNSLVVPIKPLNSDLAPTPNATKWNTIEANQTVLTNYVDNVECKVVGIVGTGATGKFTTTRTGSISSAEITRGGAGYTTLPYVTIASTVATTGQVNDLDLLATDYIARVTAATSAKFDNPIGFGFGARVGAGKIYQKGYFLNVTPQFAIVSKYSNTPSDLSIGFSTVESVVNAATDTALFDNASGFLNFSAPGANRLKLTPVIATKTTTEEEQDPEYFPIIRFSEGRPFSQNRLTQYNKLGDMIAQRTYEESGNYTLDEFNLNTRSSVDFSTSDTGFDYVIDPGHAYINGYRIKTELNYAKTVNKAKDIVTKTDQAIDFVYDNYIRVNQLAGVTEFKTGQTINFYDNAFAYYDNFDTNYTSGNVTTPGATPIGTAKIRSIIHESGQQGTANAIYRVHIFDVNVSNLNFKNIKSLYVPALGGANTDGLADAVLSSGSEYVIRTLKSTGEGGETQEFIPATYKQYAEIINAQNNSLVVDLKRATTVDSAAFGADTVDYVYRTSTRDLTVTAGGEISVGVNTYPYTGTLTDKEEDDLIIVPQEDIKLTDFETGVTLTNIGEEESNTVIVLQSSVVTTSFSSDLKAGDFITNGTTTTQVLTVVGDDRIKVRATAVAFEGAGLNLARTFPIDIPISLSNRTSMGALVNGSNDLLINLGSTVDGGPLTNAVTVIYNVKSENTTEVSLSARRNRFVKLTTAGGDLPTPKCLGLTGIFRLRAVYNGSDTTATDITNQFYVENGQNESYWGLGYLRRYDNATSTLAATILVEVDHFEASAPGLKTIDSYNINDTTPLASLGTDCHILEVPSFVDNRGKQRWLRECMDFRPFADNTAATATTAAAATTDPSATVTFTPGSGLKFPIPQGDVTYDISYYKNRTDIVSVTVDGEFEVTTGTRQLKKNNDEKRIDLYKVKVPPYPSLPKVFSKQLKEIADIKVQSKGVIADLNRRYGVRFSRLTVQNKGYTMEMIATLERRIAALEYNQNLSLLENETKNRTFQSSIDSTLEKFKFGFFVDNFEDYRHTKLNDPEHNASIYEYVLQPAKQTLNIALKPGTKSTRFLNGKKISFPFSRKKITSQRNATYGPFVAPPPPPEIKEFCEFITSRNRNFIGKATAPFSELRNVWEEFTFVGSNETDGVSRNIEIKFYNPDGGISFEIIQSNAPPTSQSAEIGTNVTGLGLVQDLPSAEAFEIYQKFYPVIDKRGTEINPQTNVWFTSRTTGTLTTTDPANTYTTQRGAGKITIPYDYTKGRYITVRALKAKPTFNFEVCYPGLSSADVIFDSGQTLLDTTPPCPPKGKFRYNRCLGNDLVTYVHDGLCGTTVGSTFPNSPSCITVIPPINPPVTPCPPSGTFFKEACIGTTKVTYTYTGKRVNGKCTTGEDSSSSNSQDCGYIEEPAGPECDGDTTEIIIIDDGCDKPLDPGCSIIETPPQPDPEPTPVPEPEEEPIVETEDPVDTKDDTSNDEIVNPPYVPPTTNPPVSPPPTAPSGGGTYSPGFGSGKNNSSLKLH